MSQTDYNCNKCDLKDTERMVQCDSCDKWFHFECVGVTSDVANVSWNCSCGNDQPAVIKNSTSNVAPQITPTVNATVEFTAGLPVASSPASHISRPFTDVPGPSSRVNSAQPPSQHSSEHEKGAYKKAQKQPMQGHLNSNINVLSDSVMATATAIGDQYAKVNNGNFCGSNTSAGFPSHTQLQLQMLEEEKELQRKYLEKKYSILSQGDVTQSSNSSLNAFSFQPTSAQIAARQVIPKELPNFNGDPEDWPLFISNFRNSTEMAGYTDGENLMRLQSCLRGRARELVKSKLLMPSMVNEII